MGDVVTMKHLTRHLPPTSGVLLTILGLTVTSLECHIFPFKPISTPGGGSGSSSALEKLVRSHNQVASISQLSGEKNRGAGIAMTPFYKSLPSRVMWSDIARIAGSKHKSRIEAGDGSLDDLNFDLNDDNQNHLTAEEMIQYLATLSQNGDIGSARGVKWGV